MIIGFDQNTQYVAGNPVWFWGATVGFPGGGGGGGGYVFSSTRRLRRWRH